MLLFFITPNAKTAYELNSNLKKSLNGYINGNCQVQAQKIVFSKQNDIIISLRNLFQKRIYLQEFI